MENTAVTIDAKYDKNHFDEIMEKATAEGLDPTLMADAKKAFHFVPKHKLRALLEAGPKEFYLMYAEVVCSAALDIRTDKNALESFFSKAKPAEGEKVVEHSFFYNALKFVMATLLGLVKFAWDTTMITGAFGVRFSLRLLKNLGMAVTVTASDTLKDARYAGQAIAESFGRNLVGVPAKAPAEIFEEAVQS